MTLTRSLRWQGSDFCARRAAVDALVDRAVVAHDDAVVAPRRLGRDQPEANIFGDALGSRRKRIAEAAAARHEDDQHVVAAATVCWPLPLSLRPEREQQLAGHAVAAAVAAARRESRRGRNWR